MKPEFRQYRKKDRQACVDVIASQVGRFLAPGEDLEFSEFLDTVEKGGAHHYLVAVVDGKIVGCGGVTWTADVASLTFGILRDGETSKGYGKALLHHRIGWVLSNHPEVKSILCETAPLTEAFFSRQGFETYYREEKYWAGQIDLVAMELSLDGIKRGPERTGRPVAL